MICHNYNCLSEVVSVIGYKQIHGHLYFLIKYSTFVTTNKILNILSQKYWLLPFLTHSCNKQHEKYERTKKIEPTLAYFSSH
jgi:hypothetical protein